MMPEEWEGRKLISSKNIAQIVFSTPNRKGVVVGYSQFCSKRAGYAEVGRSQDECLILESFAVLPKNNPNAKATSITGSLTIARWCGDDDPTFLMASLPLAMLELELCPLKKWERALPNSPPRPVDSTCLLNLLRECSLHVTVRTFGVVLWEHFFPRLGECCGETSPCLEESESMFFCLLGSQNHNTFSVGLDKLRCTQGLENGLVVHTQTGFKCQIPFAVVLDVSLYDPDGQVLWAHSQPVRCRQVTQQDKAKNASTRSSFDMGFSGSVFNDERLVASIGNETTQASLTVEFRVGELVESYMGMSAVDDDNKNGNSTIVHEVSLRVTEDAVRTWTTM